MQFVKIGNAAKQLGVSQNTIRRWVDEDKIPHKKTPGGHRLVEISSFLKGNVKLNVSGKEQTERASIFYCRVSSNKQKNDLQRQIQLAKEKYPKHEIITDIASGINWKRKGFKSILERCLCGEVQEVVVFHRDRLSRFGYELLEFIFTKCNTRLLVHDNSDQHKSSQQELAEDVLAIITIFSCKEMGKRRYSKQHDSPFQSGQNIPNVETESGIEEVDE